MALNYISEVKHILFYPVEEFRSTANELQENRGCDSLVKLLLGLFFDSFIYRTAPGFNRPVPPDTPFHQSGVLLGSFHLRAKTVLTNGLTQTGAVASIVGAAPVITFHIYRELTVVGAALGIVWITTVYVTFLIYGEGKEQFPGEWSAPIDVYPGPVQPWSIWGSIIGLVIVGIVYTVLPEIVLIGAVGSFPILLLYSLPLCWFTHPIQKRAFDVGASLPKWSERFNLVNIAMSMLLATILLHTPATFPLSPIAILDSSATYEANLWDGILASLFSIPWLLVLAAILDVLEIGWYRSHVEWNDNPIARIVWTSVVSSGLGVLIWIAYPWPPAINSITGAMETLFVWMVTILYVYGLVTDA